VIPHQWMPPNGLGLLREWMCLVARPPHTSPREVQSTRCLLRLRLVVFVLCLLRTFSLARYSEGSSLVEFSYVFVCHEGVRRIEQQNPIVFGLVVVCYREEKIKKKKNLLGSSYGTPLLNPTNGKFLGEPRGFQK